MEPVSKSAPNGIAWELPDLEHVRIIRKQVGWTQLKLARESGLSQSFINKIERNEADPGYRTAKKIFQTLNTALANQESRDINNRTAKDIMVGNVEYVSSDQTVEIARQLMVKNNFSQLPVIDNGIVKGSITDKSLMSLENIERNKGDVVVREIMDKRFPVVDQDTRVETVRSLLEEYSAVLVDKGSGNEYGIITKHDFIKSMGLT